MDTNGNHVNQRTNQKKQRTPSKKTPFERMFGFDSKECFFCFPWVFWLWNRTKKRWGVLVFWMDMIHQDIIKKQKKLGTTKTNIFWVKTKHSLKSLFLFWFCLSLFKVVQVLFAFLDVPQDYWPHERVKQVIGWSRPGGEVVRQKF